MTPKFQAGNSSSWLKGEELICALGHCNVTNANSRVNAISTEYLQILQWFPKQGGKKLEENRGLNSLQNIAKD